MKASKEEILSQKCKYALVDVLQLLKDFDVAYSSENNDKIIVYYKEKEFVLKLEQADGVNNIL